MREYASQGWVTRIIRIRGLNNLAGVGRLLFSLLVVFGLFYRFILSLP